MQERSDNLRIVQVVFAMCWMRNPLLITGYHKAIGGGGGRSKTQKDYIKMCIVGTSHHREVCFYKSMHLFYVPWKLWLHGVSPLECQMSTFVCGGVTRERVGESGRGTTLQTCRHQ